MESKDFDKYTELSFMASSIFSKYSNLAKILKTDGFNSNEYHRFLSELEELEYEEIHLYSQFESDPAQAVRILKYIEEENYIERNIFDMIECIAEHDEEKMINMRIAKLLEWAIYRDEDEYMKIADENYLNLFEDEEDALSYIMTYMPQLEMVFLSRYYDFLMELSEDKDGEKFDMVSEFVYIPFMSIHAENTLFESGFHHVPKAFRRNLTVDQYDVPMDIQVELGTNFGYNLAEDIINKFIGTSEEELQDRDIQLIAVLYLSAFKISLLFLTDAEIELLYESVKHAFGNSKNKFIFYLFTNILKDNDRFLDYVNKDIGKQMGEI
jgi:hypothetical protein